MGHFDEVTGLCIVGDEVISVGIDATVRRWSLRGDDIGKAVKEAQDVKDGVLKEDGVDGNAKGVGMTAEEERELEELMEGDDL